MINGRQLRDRSLPDQKLASPVRRGSTVLNFGSTPQNNARVTVTGQSEIVSGSFAAAFVMYEATADHSADEHVIAPIRLACGAIVPGVGFDVVGVSDWLLRGQFKVRWEWV